MCMMHLTHMQIFLRYTTLQNVPLFIILSIKSINRTNVSNSIEFYVDETVFCFRCNFYLCSFSTPILFLPKNFFNYYSV